MDREIGADVRRMRVAKKIAIAVIAVAAVVFSLAATVNFLRPSLSRREIQTARVERGNVEATLQASGTVMPAVEQIVASPIDARVLRIIRRAGDRVRTGDELVALDTSATRLDVDRLTAQLRQKESELASLRLKSDDATASLRATIEQRKLDAAILDFKAEQTRKLHESGLAAKQDDLAAATAAKKAQIELAQLGDQLGRERNIDQAQLASTMAALQSLRQERDESQRQLQLAMMHADRDGVVTSIVEDAGAMVRKGDVIARIADLSSFRVDAIISDIHASEIGRGMPVRVKVDDATSVSGTISSIEPRVESGTVKFHVKLDDSANAHLRNNVRVDVFVVTGLRRNTLRIRRGNLGQGAIEDVWILRGSDLVKVPVRWGLAGDPYIEPTEGLREGDEVVISNMSDYEGVKRLRLK
jgi:HlyD family secretion protein